MSSSSIEQMLNFTKLGTGKSTFQNINAVSCYINCALQSLMHLDEFKLVFMAASPPPSPTTPPTTPPTPDMLMYWSLRAIYKGYWEENCVIRPMGLFAYLDKCGFPVGSQGDSTEVLTFMIEKMHESIGVAAGEVPEVGTQMEILSIKDWNHHLAHKQSELVNLFWGQYLTKKVCGTCKTPLYKFETFHYLTLAVAHDDEADIMVPITFEVLVARFRQQKQFDLDNLFFCDTCKQKVPQATDETSVWKLPRYLIVQFNRYHSRGGPVQKCNRDIIFPTVFDPAILQQEAKKPQEEAEGAEEAEKENEHKKYHLQSGVFHHGQIHGGHYTYFGWNRDTQEWLYVDDNKLHTLKGPISRHPGIYQLIYKLI